MSARVFQIIDGPEDEAPAPHSHPEKDAYEAFVLSKLLRMTLQGLGGETTGEVKLEGGELDAFMSGLFMLEERVGGFYQTI